MIAVVDYPTPNQYTGRTARVRLIVLHSTETPANTARAVARNFQSAAARASAHWIVGTDGTYSGVAESDTAWAAPGANADGIQIEQCGYAYETDWNTGDGAAVVAATARLVAQIAARHGIPVRALTDAELAAGASGVVTHAQVSRVYRKSDHTDPGPNYPLSTLIALAGAGTTTTTTPTTGTTTASTEGNTMYLISTPLSDGGASYALITEVSGARTLDANETGTYTKMLGTATSLPWDWYWLAVRQAWERYNALAALVGKQADEAADSVVARLQAGLTPAGGAK